jgi:hypothetical protein
MGVFPIWKCNANEAGAELTDYSIECEGKNGENDPFVLKNSCFILYRVIFNTNY